MKFFQLKPGHGFYTTWNPYSPTPIAFMTKSEPGWRVVKIKGHIDEKYKLTIVPIRFWGHRVLPSTSFRGKVDNSYQAIIEELNNRKSGSFIGSMRDTPPVPIPLGKSRKQFTDVIDLLEPGETDQEALARIETHFEHQRQVSIFSQIREVMES
jgi:hypothetical protein